MSAAQPGNFIFFVELDSLPYMGYANSVSIMCPTAAIAKGKKQKT